MLDSAFGRGFFKNCIMAGSEKIVSVFGSGKVGEDSDEFKLAEEIGYALAKNGWAIANGGYNGTMLAGSKGAASANGKVIGVTCRAFKSTKGNAYVTETVVTDNLDERVKTLIDMADAYVVLPGATGTLLELASVWELKNKKFMAFEKPVILMGDYWQVLVDLMGQKDPDCLRCIQTAKNADEMVEILHKTFKSQPIK